MRSHPEHIEAKTNDTVQLFSKCPSLEYETISGIQLILSNALGSLNLGKSCPEEFAINYFWGLARKVCWELGALQPAKPAMLQRGSGFAPSFLEGPTLETIVLAYV